MIIWIDAQPSPALARWLRTRFRVEAGHVRELGLLEAKDPVIFESARVAGSVLLTKDRDFVELVKRRGGPPKVIWVTCGNTSNEALMRILERLFEKACLLLEAGESVVEIKG